MRENDSISTLNQNVIDGLVGQNLPVIECAKRINASLGTPELHDSHSTAGQLAVADSVEENCGIEGAGISVQDESGRVVHLRNITFPGRNCGFYIAGAIDDNVARLRRDHGDRAGIIGAFVTSILGPSHLFSGANGRTAFGTGEVCNRESGLVTYRTAHLSRRDVDQITQIMSDITFHLLPQGYNPRDILADPRSYPHNSVISLPYQSNLDSMTEDERYELNRFVGAFAASIVEFINDFNPEDLNDIIGRNILRVSQIMRRGLKDRPWLIKRVF
jgi:hypothetical protein